LSSCRLNLCTSNFRVFQWLTDSLSPTPQAPYSIQCHSQLPRKSAPKRHGSFTETSPLTVCQPPSIRSPSILYFDAGSLCPWQLHFRRHQHHYFHVNSHPQTPACKVSSLPNCALKSPNRIFTQYLQRCSNTSSHYLQKLSSDSSVLSSEGTCAFTTDLSALKDNLKLAYCTLLTALTTLLVVKILTPTADFHFFFHIQKHNSLLSHLTSFTRNEANLYFANSLPTVFSDPWPLPKEISHVLCLIFHANFRCLYHSKWSVQVRCLLKHFTTRCPPPQPWRVIPLSAVHVYKFSTLTTTLHMWRPSPPSRKWGSAIMIKIYWNEGIGHFQCRQIKNLYRKSAIAKYFEGLQQWGYVVSNKINTHKISADKHNNFNMSHPAHNNKYDTSILSRFTTANKKGEHDTPKTTWAKFTYVGKEPRFTTELFNTLP
jgi:hypothetical protein